VSSSAQPTTDPASFYRNTLTNHYAKAMHAATADGKAYGFAFDKPSTKDVLFCDGALAAPNDGTTGPVAAILGAGFNRTTLHDTAAQPTTDPAAFYGEQITHHYAKAMHAATADGKAYGFAFDDVADFASYIQDTAPTAFTLTLTPF